MYKNIILYLIIFFINGCAYTASFNRSPYVDQNVLGNYLKKRPNKQPEQIIFLKTTPSKPFIVLGT